MNLYRVDIIRASDGAPISTVSDMLGPRLIRAWKDARRAAIDAVSVDAAPMGGIGARITRISGAGSLRVVGFVKAGSSTVERVNQ